MAPKMAPKMVQGRASLRVRLLMLIVALAAFGLGILLVRSAHARLVPAEAAGSAADPAQGQLWHE